MIEKYLDMVKQVFLESAPFSKFSSVDEDNEKTISPEEYERHALIALRTLKSIGSSKKPRQILSDPLVDRLLLARPRSQESFLMVDGLGKETVARNRF